MRVYPLHVSLAAFALGAMTASAGAATFDLNQISTSTIGTSSQGTVTLTQNGANEVDVDVTLTNAAIEQFVNTGGPHTPFVFNLDLLTVYTITITTTTTPTFTVGPGGESDTPYGTFVNSIDSDAHNGAHGNPGPLDFKVTDASGISISDFVANAGGYYFAADLLGTNGGTGAVASNGSNMTVVVTPLPGALPLFGSGLGAIALLLGRGKRKKQATV